MCTNKWFRQVLFISVIMVIAGCASNSIMPAGRKLNLYVSNNGNDAWSGRLANADRNKGDGPFKTLERARDEIRRLK